jgi:hypothetical protein
LGGSFADQSQDAVIGLRIAYQATGGTLTDANTISQVVRLTYGDQPVVSLSAVISGLAPGTYQVGLAGAWVGGTGGTSVTAFTGATSALVFQS